jgi:hypothetical protein
MDILLAGNGPSLWKGRLPALMSSAAICGNHSGTNPNTIPGQAGKCSAFRPESCSPSSRNRVRDHPGTLFGFTPEPRSPSPGIRTEVVGVMAEHAGPLQQLLMARRFRKEIDIALGIDPKDVQAWRDLVEFYLLAPGIAGGDSAKAAAAAERIAAIDEAEGYLAKARIAAFHKQVSESEALTRKAVEAQPRNYRARIALAKLYLTRSSPSSAEAETEARAALRLDSGRIDAYVILAEGFERRSAWPELEAVLGNAEKEVPDDLAPWYRAADLLLTSKQELPRAERYLRRYLTQEPDGNQPSLADAHWKLGLVLEAEERIADAIAEWTDATRLDPKSQASRELKRVGKVRGASMFYLFGAASGTLFARATVPR